MTSVSIRISAIDNCSKTIEKIQGSLRSLNKQKVLGGLVERLRPLQQTIIDFKNSLVTVSRSLVGFTVFAATTAGLFRWGKAAADVANQLIDLSNKYQVSTESIQVYSSLIEGAGGTMEDVGKSMSKLQHAMSEAVAGSADYQAAFHGIGIGVEELKTLSPENVMLRMANAFEGSNNAVAKQEVLLKLLGERGAMWLETLNEGAKEYQNRLDEMRADGALISEEDMIRARDFNDTWDRISRLTRAIHVDFSLDFMKAFEPTLNSMREALIANRSEIRQGLKELAVALPPVLEVLSKLFGFLVRGVTLVARLFSKLQEAFGATNVAIGIAAVALYKLWTPFVPLLGKLIKLVFNFSRAIGFIPSLFISALVVAFTHIDEIVDYVQAAFDRLKKIFSASFVEGVFATLVELITGLINGAVGFLKSIAPEAIQPNWLKNWDFSSPTERLANINSKLPQKAERVKDSELGQGISQRTNSAFNRQQESSDVKGQITVKVITDRNTKAVVQGMESDNRLLLRANTGVMFGGN